MSAESDRRAAVSKAWEREAALIKEGKGTRDWTPAQQKEILSTHRCKGYEGHHKLSVSQHPEQAGNPDNIQFVTRKEHIDAHQGNFKNDPQGRYDPKQKTIEKYEKGKVKSEPQINLSKKLSDRNIKTQENNYKKLQEQKKAERREKNAKKIQEKMQKEARQDTAKNHQAVKKSGTDKRMQKSRQKNSDINSKIPAKARSSDTNETQSKVLAKPVKSSSRKTELGSKTLAKPVKSSSQANESGSKALGNKSSAKLSGGQSGTATGHTAGKGSSTARNTSGNSGQSSGNHGHSGSQGH